MSRFASTNNKALVAVFLLLSKKPLSQFNCLIGLSLKNGTCSSNFRRQSPKILISQPSNVKHIGLLETYKEYIPAWMRSNPGTLCKIGGKQVILTRHHDPTQYNPLYFNTSKAIVFAGTFTESRLAAWFELKLIQFAFSLDIGVNNNRDSPYNMACGYMRSLYVFQ